MNEVVAMTVGTPALWDRPKEMPAYSLGLMSATRAAVRLPSASRVYSSFSVRPRVRELLGGRGGRECGSGGQG